MEFFMRFQCKGREENSSKLTIQNKCVHETKSSSNNNEIRVINCGTSENLIAQCIIFPHVNIYKCT
jgi:hypothetical protein